jgi:hypothetical protein
MMHFFAPAAVPEDHSPTPFQDPRFPLILTWFFGLSVALLTLTPRCGGLFQPPIDRIDCLLGFHSFIHSFIHSFSVHSIVVLFC